MKIIDKEIIKRLASACQLDYNVIEKDLDHYIKKIADITDIISKIDNLETSFDFFTPDHLDFNFQREDKIVEKPLKNKYEIDKDGFVKVNTKETR